MRNVSPYDHIHKLRIKPHWAGMSVLDLFHSRFSYISKTSIEEKILCGDILIDDEKVQPDFTLTENSLLKHIIRGRTEPEVSTNIVVLHEDDELLVVVKPAPMPVHPCGRYFKNSLSYILEEERPGVKLFTTHRLDSLTSGIVIFAKTKSTAAKWSDYFLKGLVQKTYLAKINGSLDSEIRIEKGIRRKNAYLFECHDDGKEAVTIVKPFAESASEKNIVECSPLTGRTHQIRLHLAFADIPIVDDPWYNPKLAFNRDVNRLYNDEAISLLAYRYQTPDHVFQAPFSTNVKHS